MQKNANPIIAVYCSAADNLPQKWIEAADHVGRWIGHNNATLIYGGVNAGLMTIVAQAVKNTGKGRIIGVVPMLRSEMASPLNDVQIPAEGLSDRKANMLRMSDIFIVLPGGYGTLDELLSTFAYIRFNGLSDKKILIYNPDALYDSLFNQFKAMIDNGLMDRHCLNIIAAYNNIDDLIKALNEYFK